MKSKIAALLVGIPVFAFSAIVGATEAPDSYPTKPITLVIPAPPGGSNDIFGRLLGKEVTKMLGQPVIIENKPGANYSIAATYLARSKPDGYTLLLTGAPTFTVNPVLYKGLGYDVDRDFELVAVTGGISFVVLTNPSTGIASVQDMIARARSSPQRIPYATFGAGSTPHLGGERIADAAGIKMEPVPYKGSAPGISDLIGKHIPLSIDTTVAALPHVRSGQLVAVAQTGKERSPLLPNVPTLIESGLPGVDFDTWFGVVAPKGTPTPVIKKLAVSLQKIMQDPQIENQLLELGLDSRFKDAQAFKQTIQSEQETNRAAIEKAKIRVQ